MSALALVFSTALFAQAQQPQQQGGATGNSAAGGAQTTGAARAAVGSTVADFQLPDASGTQRTLASLRGERGTVLIFVSTQCPVSNAYNERMERLAQEYAARGVRVVGINSNREETPEAISAHARTNNLTFPILKDMGNRIADQFGAQFTPEVFFLDASNRVVYHGRIDNNRNAAQANTADLRNAIDAVLANRPIAVTEARAFGCTIKRVGQS